MNSECIHRANISGGRYVLCCRKCIYDRGNYSLSRLGPGSDSGVVSPLPATAWRTLMDGLD